ncbi:MAG TPA: GNAT family N-acetyltransferase [Polyangia bacterium]
MSTAVTTRLAAATDGDLLGSVDPTADRARRELVEAAIAGGRCWVAELDARVVGYGIVSQHFFARDFVELLFVAASARRRGVGNAILSAIERAVTADRLFTSTNESNAPMRTLLAKSGYVESGRIDNLDEGDPELVFVKFLSR